jgi:fatty acid desaturase
MEVNMETIKNFKTPTVQNIAIQFIASSVSLYSLYQASHLESIYLKILFALIFTLSNNTLFSLLHESVHRCYSKNVIINEVAGNFAAFFFPTALIFQRICHLGHHLRNRTDHEMFDMYYPTDNKLIKFTQFYCILTGFYWISIPFGCFMYMTIPSSYNFFVWLNEKNKSTDAAMMIPFLNHPLKSRIRLEMFGTLIFQILIFKLLNLNLASWFLCYWIFGMNWGGLQYADHAWTERDIRNGAWNLKVPKMIQAIYLNYHLHKVHHQNPQLPWNLLPKYENPNDIKPSYFKIWLEMWKGPRPVNSPAPKPIDDEFRKLIGNE